MSMTRPPAVKQFFTRNPVLKLLCLALALSVWLLSSSGRRIQVDVPLPVTLVDVPAGYAPHPAPPARISCTLSGPSILLDGALRSHPELKLSMAGAVAPGSTVFMHLESHLKLPEGISVVRISPATLEIHLTARQSPAGGLHP